MGEELSEKPVVQVAENEYHLVANEEELLVLWGVLQSEREEEEHWLKHNIFYIIINRGNCENVVAT